MEGLKWAEAVCKGARHVNNSHKGALSSLWQEFNQATGRGLRRSTLAAEVEGVSWVFRRISVVITELTEHSLS